MCQVFTFTKRMKTAVLFWIFLDQICPKWINLDQTWSNWISHKSKNVTIKSCHVYQKDHNGSFVLDFFQICPKLIWSSFLARNAEMAFLARYGFLRQFIFWQENFITIILLSNESALLLKVLKGMNPGLMAESF